MSHHGKLREDKRCENCGHYVEERFCPECGQENVETRQPFHYLFIHFIEDFVHYDSRFWKTIRDLLFHPARLTKVYLSGKRMRYVPPVTLYIFISFITFFFPAILPDMDEKKKEAPQETTTEKKADDTDNTDNETLKINDKHFNKKEWEEKLGERVIHDLPKAIFLYMPVFAFWLWLFHNKKWYYFDHGIFTLHYFSFLLLSILLYYVFIFWGMSFFHIKIHSVKILITFTMLGYFIYYFFHSHRLVYQETKRKSRFKCSVLFIINTICIFIFFLLFLVIELFLTNNVLFNEMTTVVKKSL